MLRLFISNSKETTNNLVLSSNTENVGVSNIGDGKNANAEVFTAGSSQFTVVSRVVVDGALGKHGVVIDFRLAKGRGVTGNDDHLGLVQTKGLDGSLVAKNSLARLHDELDLGVDTFNSLLGFLHDRGHC